MAKWTTCRMIRRCRGRCSRLVVLSSVIAGICLPELDVTAAPQLLGSHYRADVPYPQFARFWSDNCLLGEDWAESIGRTIPRATTLGGSVHLFIRNDDPKPLTIADVSLQDISLRQAVAFSDQRRLRKPASIFFSSLTETERQKLIDAGEPIWWRADPPTLAPGDVGEVSIRLRYVPKVAELRVECHAASQTVRTHVAIQEKLPRIEGASFDESLARVFVYLKDPEVPGSKPERVFLDGRDVTSRCRIAADPNTELTPVILDLPTPLKRGSLHSLQAVYADGRGAWAGIRAFADPFVYGVWGGPGGQEDDLALAQTHIRLLHDLSVNTQMPQVGSAALAAFYKTTAGQQLCHDTGLDFVLSDPGKWGIQNAYAYFIHDEPDAGDAKITGLPPGHEVGSLAQWAISKSDEWRTAAPAAPHLLNVDLTYKPQNYYVYGQLPDVLLADPYYDPRLRTAYWNHPYQLPLYARSTFVYAISSVVRSAAAPKPSHIILYANAYVDEKNNREFRYPTPAGKRIEVYYALAAGAKGISYWWWSPGKPAHGLGGKRPDAATLRREVGLIGAEIGTAAPLLRCACPSSIPVEPPAALWTRCLLVGHDTLVLVAVNEQYANDREGTVLTPLEKVQVRVSLPAWLAARDAFEIHNRGVEPLPITCDGHRATLDLGTVELPRLVVVTADPALREQLDSRYRTLFAARVARLLSVNPEPTE